MVMELMEKQLRYYRKVCNRALFLKLLIMPVVLVSCSFLGLGWFPRCTILLLVLNIIHNHFAAAYTHRDVLQDEERKRKVTDTEYQKIRSKHDNFMLHMTRSVFSIIKNIMVSRQPKKRR